MNRRDKDLLLLLSARTCASQREMAEACGCSLGAVNASVHTLLTEGYIDAAMALTPKSHALLQACAPRRAVLLAAGPDRPFSLTATPRPLLEVEGEPLIQRLIRQLQEVGIRDITVVIGYQKERFEYLIDLCGVELVVNPLYALRNNLHSLALVAHRLENAYVVPCDLWFRDNPFRSRELYSWYMVTQTATATGTLRINRKQELVVADPATGGNAMVGVSYLMGQEAAAVRQRLARMDADRRYEGAFWEETLYEGDKLLVGAREIPADQAIEIHSREDWRGGPRTKAADIAADALGVPPEEITHLTPLKKGAVNHTYSFVCRGERYALRIPIPGADPWINRAAEAEVYRTLADRSLADEVVYLHPDTGVKISRYIEHDHACDPQNPQDVSLCMSGLRAFHQQRLTVPYDFELFGSIDYFESLWQGTPSAYADYAHTKERVFALREYIDRQPKDRCLTHIDPVPDNFLMINDSTDLRLIDWEYAAMQDPHLDIAMFCLYALYDRDQVDRVIAAYFPEGCDDAVRLKIYCYIAAGGLLWSNWCEYLQKTGTEFGGYSLRQYRYTKEYYRLAHRELERIKENEHAHCG